jgi:hypothetical protein
MPKDSEKILGKISFSMYYYCKWQLRFLQKYYFFYV